VKPKSRRAWKKYIVLLVALLLIGGLLLGAVVGIIDYVALGEEPVPSGVDDYIIFLEQQAAGLEEALSESPGDIELQARLGSIYYELAMHYWQEGDPGGAAFAAKSKEVLLEAVKGGTDDPQLTMRLALLCFFQEEDEQAEEYFQMTLHLDEDNPEAHLYYGIFLSSQGLDNRAAVHLRKVLQLVEEESYLGQTARLYLELQEEKE